MSQQEEKEKKHFWYSKMAHEDIITGNYRSSRLKELIEELNELFETEDLLRDEQKILNYCLLDTGEIVMFTEQTSSEPVSNYPDQVYLGIGVYDHEEPIFN